MNAANTNPDSAPVALITGASSGIGSVFARRLAARGCNLILVARRKDRLEAMSSELSEKHKIAIEALAADLADDVERARVEERIRTAPNLEFLVNNAGFGSLNRFWKEPLDSQDRMHRLHVLATMRLTHEALPVMLARGKGRIVNVSSVSGFMQSVGGVSYSATKAWMNSFTQGLRLELEGNAADVRVQALCPGFTYTEFHDALNLDRNFIGRSWWMSAESVVDASLAGLEANRSPVIPGVRYKLIVLALKYAPGAMLRALTPKSARNRSAYVKPPLKDREG